VNLVAEVAELFFGHFDILEIVEQMHRAVRKPLADISGCVSFVKPKLGIGEVLIWTEHLLHEAIGVRIAFRAHLKFRRVTADAHTRTGSAIFVYVSFTYQQVRKWPTNSLVPAFGIGSMEFVARVDVETVASSVPPHSHSMMKELKFLF